ncbi:MAG: alginate export family protein [Candidatus Omnitrophica bacterium]|nr:alginate export family protein [Candidatus Omnitrophota bacterium]
MKLAKLLLVLGLVVVASTMAYAETQSVKVSGDLGVRGMVRNNYDLDRADASPVNLDGESSDYAQDVSSTTEVEVAADLTDNVGSVVRLVNQRQWGDNNYTNFAGGELAILDPRTNNAIANRTVLANADSFDMDLDLAYINLKEFLYSPLTLKIGRQDLWFGKGFIIGAQQQDPNNQLYAPEYTAINSFDSVRATLDYNPWTIDVVYALIRENFRRSDDDTNLTGANVGYVFDEYKAEAEAYYWWKQQRYNGTTAQGTKFSVRDNVGSNDVHTLGMRGSFDPIEDWTIALEGAAQLGKYVGIANQLVERDRSAWAFDAGVECRTFQDDFAWRPVVGLEYIYYSGQENIGNQAADVNANGQYNGWDTMYRGKFDTAIREFQNIYYRTATASTPSCTNQHQVLLTGTIEPTDSLNVDLTYGHFWLAQEYASNTTAVAENTDTDLGHEIDINLTWDYTEDVQFGLLTGWFLPGNHFASGQDDPATDVVGSVKLSF